MDEATVVGNDSGFNVDAGESVSVPTAKILANDVDPDSTLTAIKLVSAPLGGDVELDADGNVVFTADSTFAGKAVVRYVAVTETGAESDAGEIVFDVQPALDINTIPQVETTTAEAEPSVDETPQETEPENTAEQTETAGPVESDEATAGSGSMEEAIAGVMQGAGEDVQGDNTADTGETEAVAFDSSSNTKDFKLGESERSYVYQTVSSVVDIDSRASFDRGVASSFSTMLTTFNPATMVAYWDNVDTARHDFLHEFEFVNQPVVASVTSVLTVGYLAWIIRGGVLLTTFMSSIPAWQAFDPLPVIEQGAGGDDTEDDQSIEELVN